MIVLQPLHKIYNYIGSTGILYILCIKKEFVYKKGLELQLLILYEKALEPSTHAALQLVTLLWTEMRR